MSVLTKNLFALNSNRNFLLVAGDDDESEDSPKEIVLEDNLSHRGRPDEPNNYLSYFLLVSVVAISAYLVFHNKQKVQFNFFFFGFYVSGHFF